MEPSGGVPQMPLHKDLRPKQAEVIRLFETKNNVVAKLPTGYGKTVAAAGSYAVLRHRGVCNRMLFIVPRRSQATQAADGLPDDLKRFFGITTKSIIVSEHQIQAHRLHRSGEAEVFVATIQALTTGDSFKTITDMMQTGRWFVAADELHHYSQRAGNGKDGPREDGIWADRLHRLNASAMLAMSATTKRFDGLDRFGAPDVSETYVHAANVGYVKKLSLHAYEFHVETVTVDGVEYTYSTDEFLNLVGSDNPADVDAFMASRQMRWSPKYITPLIEFPMQRLINNRLDGIESQMLVQAMSVAHAKFVCAQIEALKPRFMSVDWVGTGPNGRKDNENDAILARFCPPKDKITGRRKWTLNILVNVGIAGEGLDATDVTEVSFLSLANINITTLQGIGRGARVMPVPKGVDAPPCHVNVDTSSPLADYVGAAIMGLFDDEVTAKPPGPPRGPGDDDDYVPSPPTMNVMVVDVRLKDIRSEPMYQAVLDHVKRQYPEADEEMVARSVEDGIQRYLSRGSSESSLIGQKRELIDALVSKIVGLITTRIRTSGSAVTVDRVYIAKLKTKINAHKKGKFGPVESLASDELDGEYQWLREHVELPILQGHALQGLPSWLR